MSQRTRSLIAAQIEDARAGLASAWDVMRRQGPGRIQFWFIALVIGIAAGFAALLFRKGIEALQATLYGTDDVLRLHSFAETLAWYWIVVIPVAGRACGRADHRIGSPATAGCTRWPR